MAKSSVQRSLLFLSAWAIAAVICLLAVTAHAAIAIDQLTSADRSSSSASITTAAFSTGSGNELLLAFISSDAVSAGITVTNVTGAGLTWTLVNRANSQLGTSEIWRAFAVSKLTGVTVQATLSQNVAASITVVALTGTDPSGNGGSGAIGALARQSGSSGAPTASLITSRPGSLVFGVGNDYDMAVARTLPTGQTLLHQYLATVGDTYWVQRQSVPIATAGTPVTINDTAPTGDRWNLAIVEVLAAASGGYAITGSAVPAGIAAGAVVTLTQNNAAVAAAPIAADGSYSLAGISNGTYTLTPSKTGVAFNPPSQSVTVSGGAVTVPAFSVTLSGFSVTGTVTPAAIGSGARVDLSQGGTAIASTSVAGDGSYLLPGIPNGTYVVSPSKPGAVFTPPSRTVTVNNGPVTIPNFVVSASILYPDLSVIIPASGVSIAGSGSSRVFQYTHDTFNGGPGPLVIQPVYNQASGTYQGFQYLYSFNGSQWILVQQVPVAGAFVFHAEHGHFHFPFASFGLYASNPDGSIGAPIALSEKVGFCIADSFIYAPTLPNAGAIGNLGSCADPTSLRGLDIGAVDEYDKSDPGESIPIPDLPDGTYWLRAIVDPDNYLAEATEANNETDAQVSIVGNTVTVLKVVTPVLPPPPAVTLATPAGGAVLSGPVTITATTGSAGTVQFLLDGNPLGSAIVSSPYSLVWDTRDAVNGGHWLAAQTTDRVTGRIGTSAVANVTVSNSSTSGDTTPPTIQIDSPAAGSIVSASVAVSATAADDTGVANVQFYVDGVPSGSALTAPPFVIYWNTSGWPDGQHVLTATATDTVGHVTTSSPVTVTVDNSHPPMVIGKDVTVWADGSGTMQTPAFATKTADDLLVAFVAYDGPVGAPQTATVSGAGLTWELLKRSNSQGGTSEIWFARASGFLNGVTVASQPGTGGSYHGSLTVIAFTNASGLGVVGQASAPSGAPDIYLPGVGAGSWVFAVGNDWDRAVSRTPVSGQVLVHQRVDTGIGDTYWVQSTAVPSTATALVTIHDTAPTTDQWNYCAVEIVPKRQ